MIKTAIENKQNLIVEGCYIPFDWAKDFTEEYRREIHYYCLVMSEDYIRKNFANIRKYASIVEDRQEDEDCTMEWLLEENARFLEMSSKYGANQILIHDAYAVDIHL